MTPAMHLLAAAAATEPSILFVALMGIGTVLLGLTCIIFICMLMSALCRKFSKPEEAASKPEAPAAAPAASAAPAPQSDIPNRTELLAAITAAIAEELGTDVSAIRVHSFKRIG
ncbi:MAG: OadG family protein [Eubacteriales bacterium]